MTSAAESLIEQLRTIARAEALAVVKAEKKAVRYDLVAHTELPLNLARQARAVAKTDPATLPALKEGAITYFDRAALDRWLESKRIQPRAGNDVEPQHAAPSPTAPTTAQTASEKRRARWGLAGGSR